MGIQSTVKLSFSDPMKKWVRNMNTECTGKWKVSNICKEDQPESKNKIIATINYYFHQLYLQKA